MVSEFFKKAIAGQSVIGDELHSGYYSDENLCNANKEYLHVYEMSGTWPIINTDYGFSKQFHHIKRYL